MLYKATALACVLTLVACPLAAAMTISKSDTAPASADVLLSFDTTATGSQNFFTIDRGGGAETAFGQTFRFASEVLLDKITIKVRTTQDVSRARLLLWFGTGYTGPLDSGLSSLILTPEADLPADMNTLGEISYLTLDIEDQLLTAGQTYAFMPRFATGGAGGHVEMNVGFMGTYAYADGAAFTFAEPIGYNTILNNEMVFYLQGAWAPLPGDFNLDGVVDGADFLAWQRGESPDLLSSADLADWQANYGNAALAAMSVPEPSAFTLALLGILTALNSLRATRA